MGLSYLRPGCGLEGWWRQMSPWEEDSGMPGQGKCDRPFSASPGDAPPDPPRRLPPWSPPSGHLLGSYGPTMRLLSMFTHPFLFGAEFSEEPSLVYSFHFGQSQTWPADPLLGLGLGTCDVAVVFICLLASPSVSWFKWFPHPLLGMGCDPGLAIPLARGAWWVSSCDPREANET